MDWDTFFLTILILAISGFINHFYYKYIQINPVIESSKKRSNYKIDKNLYESNHAIKYLDSLGEDIFGDYIEIFVNSDSIKKQVFANITNSDLLKKDPRETLVFFGKLLKYDREHFDNVYGMDKFYRNDKLYYVISKETTDYEKMYNSLWEMLLVVKDSIKKDEKDVVSNAMGMMTGILNAPNFIGNNFDEINTAPILQGMFGNMINQFVEIEEIDTKLEITDNDKSILDELNFIGENIVDTSNDVIEDVKTDLEKELEDLGHI